MSPRSGGPTSTSPPSPPSGRFVARPPQARGPIARDVFTLLPLPGGARDHPLRGRGEEDARASARPAVRRPGAGRSGSASRSSSSASRSCASASSAGSPGSASPRPCSRSWSRSCSTVRTRSSTLGVVIVDPRALGRAGDRAAARGARRDQGRIAASSSQDVVRAQHGPLRITTGRSAVGDDASEAVSMPGDEPHTARRATGHARCRGRWSSRRASRAASSRGARPRGGPRGTRLPPDRRAAGSRGSAGGRLGRRHAPPTGRSVSPRRTAAPVGAASPGALEALECRSNERADRLEHVAALLHENGRELERAEAATRFPITVGRHGERRVRIVRRGIDAERDDECLARMRARGLDEAVDTARARRRRPTRARAGRSGSPLRPRRRTRGSAGTIPPPDRRAPTL